MSSKQRDGLALPMQWISRVLLGPRYLTYTIFLEHRQEGEYYARAVSALYFAGFIGWFLTAVLELPVIRGGAAELAGALGLPFTGAFRAYLAIIPCILISIVVWWRKPMFDASLREFERSDFVKNPHGAVIFSSA